MSAHASGARIPGDSVFDRARDKVAIEDYLDRNGVKLKRSGSERRGPCVLCDSGTTKFCVKGETWRCYGCDERGGDISDLVARHRRMSPYEAAKWLLDGDVPISPPRERPAEAPKGPSASDKVAEETWSTAKPFTGTLAERYLIGRGIAAGLVMAAACQLRYHAAAKHHWDERARDWVRAPAMVAQVVVPGSDGEPVPTGGVHCTYLDRATAGKAAIRLPDGTLSSKRMWGPQHRDGRAGGAWLIGPATPLGHESGLVTGEGIETALSLATLAWRAGRTKRVAAALSLNRLQGVLKRDDDGCVDLERPEADPAVAVFTWPAPTDDPWPDVLIGVDRDMSPVKVRIRTGRGKIVDARLDAEARARICGQLATRAWLNAGAARARAIAPPPASDFNDELRRVLARECDA